MSGEYGLKEMKELLVALEFLGVKGKQIAKDGLGVEDLPKFVELMSGFPLFQAAYEGVGEIPKEAKDIDAEEAVELVLHLYKMAEAIRLA